MPGRARKALNIRIAEALTAMLKIEVDGIVLGSKLGQRHRELLIKTHYLQEIIKGWYYVSNPYAQAGDTAWMVHFWAFLAQYLRSRFGDDYCVSSEASLRIQSGLTTVPEQVSVIVTRVDNNLVKLPSNKSIFPMKLSELPTDREKVNGVWCMTLEASLAQASPKFFIECKDLAVAALQSADPNKLLKHLLTKTNVPSAGRIAGAYEILGRTTDANLIVSSMAVGRVDVKPENPFAEPIIVLGGSRTPSPYRNRIRTMWADMRSDVLSVFPDAPSQNVGKATYLQNMDAAFVADAYNSLSIEGYKVTEELIERVVSGAFDPENQERDRSQHDAMAASGYYQAFQVVRRSVGRILDGENAGKVFQADHQLWNQAMCQPMIDAKAMKLVDAMGYRNNVVMINGSNHVPPPSSALMDCMQELAERLELEPSAAVRTILGHFFFVFIHPLPDRNGRMGRFLMNSMLASGNYPWTVIRVSERRRYMAALEKASAGQNIKPFAEFVAGEMAASTMDGR
jgi:hypothetical protein